MKDQCSAVKRNGERCTLPANGQQGLCWAHDPRNAERRRRGASRGGKAKAGKAVKELHELLEDLTTRVIDGELETSRGAVANQLVTTRIKLFEYERRLREMEELEDRGTQDAYSRADLNRDMQLLCNILRSHLPREMFLKVNDEICALVKRRAG